MKQSLITVCFLIVTNFSFCQWDAKKYKNFWDAGDSLYEADDFKNAALAYSSALVVTAENISLWERWITARSWSMANYPDSAFYHLDFIANSSKVSFSFLNEIQTDEDLALLHSDKRWQEEMNKMYRTARKTFLSSWKESAGELNIPERFESACAWALMNTPDSAFAQLKIIAETKGNTFTPDNTFHTDTILSSLHQDSRWQLVVKEIYKNVAMSYSSRIRSGHWTNTTNDGYDAACAWALANESDSAFSYLDKIVNTDYNVFIDYPKISNDRNLVSLHSDKRWPLIRDVVKGNWIPRFVKHTFNGPYIPMVATLDPANLFLKSDGLGPYRNGVDKVSSGEQHAYNLMISGHKTWYASGDRNDLSSRFVLLDFNSPINGSGAVAQGIVRDNDLELHVLYKFDTAKKPKLVYNFREIPVGTTVVSDRTEIIFYIDGILHTLTMGPWALGDNNEPLAHKGHLNGKGTTPVRITRHSESSYTIEAIEGSIGRLWDTQNLTKPVDMGLFKTSFIIHLQYQ